VLSAFYIAHNVSYDKIYKYLAQVLHKNILAYYMYMYVLIN